MKILRSDILALIVIDIQKDHDYINLLRTERNNPEAEKNANILLNSWRAKNFPIFHIQYCYSNFDSLSNESAYMIDIKGIVSSLRNETSKKNNSNNAFIGTNLKKLLDSENISRIVFVGLSTDHFMSKTVRMARGYGFVTYVVSDATATFSNEGSDGQFFSAELIHRTTLASITREFGTVVSTKEMIRQINEK
jgi:nicotinamidase-related amidase